MLDVNVMGPSLVAKHVVPAIRKAGGGAIVNLGSISSFIAQPNFVTYNTTKTAILGMTRCMAMDLVADNIRVNAVCPASSGHRSSNGSAGHGPRPRQPPTSTRRWACAQLIHRCADPRNRLCHPLPGPRRSVVHHRSSLDG